ncbi:MAG: cell wall hydrolase [Gammaproteobacteria bacterium]|nr:cell wall hydrolase [Gammaproteobacteria bacterium]
MIVRSLPFILLFSGFAQGARANVDQVPDELYCLALNIYFEARGEPLEGKFAVAAVTLNRVRHPRFPSDVCSVVWQRGQFSWTHDGRPDKPYEIEAFEEALWVATVTYEFSHPSNVGEATYYHASYTWPSWADSLKPVARVGRHIFYR